jgi:hypothetical protein
VTPGPAGRRLRGFERETKLAAMRRALVIAVLVVVALVTAVPTAGAAAKAKNVKGGFVGAGGFVVEGSCPFLVYSSGGTYRAKHLARGTYVLHMCVTNVSPIHVVGTFDLLASRGQVHGTIDAELSNGLEAVPVTIAGGTGRFAGAGGNLVLSIEQFNETNCEPNLVCLNWDERGTINGSYICHHA